MPKRIPLLLCLLTLAGCTRPREHAEKVLGTVGPKPLREAAARLYKDFFASPAPDYSTVKESQWPPQFGAFHPIHVGAYRDGFTLAVTSDHELEAGIYVVPASSDFQPRATDRRNYERLADGVYWYSFKR